MKISQIIWEYIAQTDETNPVKIRRNMMNELGIQVSVRDIVDIQNDMTIGNFNKPVQDNGNYLPVVLKNV